MKRIDDTTIYGGANIFSLIIISTLFCVAIWVLLDLSWIIKMVISVFVVVIIAFVQERYLSVIINTIVHFFLPKEYKKKEWEVDQKMKKINKRGRW